MHNGKYFQEKNRHAGGFKKPLPPTVALKDINTDQISPKQPLKTKRDHKLPANVSR